TPEHSLNFDRAEAKISQFDLNAIEAAAQLAGDGDEIAALTVGSTLSRQKLPAFTLQPIVENAIKHGTSQLLDTGNVAIRARREG
ncbi:hypothetical protein MJI47_29310, partial [Salmonella enterica subsp. enterica serovar Kentucky]|nr:hypothetical protein [Salmonella enterica subsp. enterica serovar Kentucky]